MQSGLAQRPLYSTLCPPFPKWLGASFAELHGSSKGARTQPFGWVCGKCCRATAEARNEKTVNWGELPVTAFCNLAEGNTNCFLHKENIPWRCWSSSALTPATSVRAHYAHIKVTQNQILVQPPKMQLGKIWGFCLLLSLNLGHFPTSAGRAVQAPKVQSDSWPVLSDSIDFGHIRFRQNLNQSILKCATMHRYTDKKKKTTTF